jgi:2-dehydropantoate 2-reductase
MGQVPAQKNLTTIGIIGRGRAARHLSYYFANMGYPLKVWNRSQQLELLKPLADCEVVFLAIPDSQIDDFILNHTWLLRAEVVHLSGSLTTSIRCLHPLVSFGPVQFDLNFYKQIPFVTEKEAPFDFKKYFGALPNPVFEISREQKAKYHAYCVAANNFTTMLWQKYFEGMQNEFSIPAENSRTLLESTFKNITHDWKNALTGPFSRGDTETIAKNIASLQGDNLQEIYRAFQKMYRTSAKENIQYVYLEPGEMGL